MPTFAYAMAALMGQAGLALSDPISRFTPDFDLELAAAIFLFAIAGFVAFAALDRSASGGPTAKPATRSETVFKKAA